MSLIEKKGKNLLVPHQPIIPFIEGDGTGPDIWKASKRVIDTAVEKAYKGEKKILWEEVLAGEKAYNQVGDWLPEKTLDRLRTCLVGIKGPLTTPVGGGFRSLNVALRQELDLFACVRPIKYFKGVPSPVKNPQWTDMIIFRENTEDIYAGIEFLKGSDEVKKLIHFIENDLGVKNKIRFPETSSLGIKPISKQGTQRLIRAAIEHALTHKKSSVSIVHKGNIMKFTEGAFKKWGYQCAEEEYTDKVFTWNQYEKIKTEKGVEEAEKAQTEAIKNKKLIIKDVIADAFLQQILTRPKEYSVVATMNLNGDYISDALAAIVGGIGIAPGANINYNSGHAIFEATHGTAPKYANLDKVNPCSLILSAVMMLEYIQWGEAAKLIHQAVSQTILSKKVTYDFARLMEGSTLMTCSGFADEIIKEIKK